MSQDTHHLSIGIVGNGFVGQATQGFSCSKTRLVIFDIDPLKCDPVGTTWRDVAACDLVMVSVPTPMRPDGSCSTRIVDSVIQELRAHGNPAIILRSTVPVGFSASRKVFFMPEFLTEAAWADDFRTNPLWILGIDQEDPVFQDQMKQVIQWAKAEGKLVSDALQFVSTKEAEAIKYFRNCFLATKVAFCNEFYDFCASHKIDYSSMVDLAASDSRIGQGHTRVPGPDGRRGFGGTCFPKDISSLIHQFKLQEVPSPLLDAAQQRNNEKDRPSHDWKDLVGRAIDMD